MPSSEFAPLAPTGGRAGGFRPLPAEGDGAAVEVDPGPDPAVVAAEAARQAIYAQGVADGRASRDAEIAALHAAVRDTLEQVARFRGDLRHRYERELLEVALGVARKVVRDEVAEHPERWLTMIREAIRRAVDREHVVVRVPPALGAFLRDADPPLRTTLDDVKLLEIVDDPGLCDGACVLDMRLGEVDLGIETQLEACRTAMIGGES